MMKNVLVTGGAGFIGSHMCAALLDSGMRVYCLDDFSTGSYENIEGFGKHPSFELIEKNVCETPLLDVDAVFHLACPASPVHYQRDPLETVRTAVMGTWKVFERAHQMGARVVYASTSEIYGDPEQNPQTEAYWGNVNCYGPRACYDEGKRVGETLAYEYVQSGKTDVRVARIFNTYGPRMRADDGRVVSNVIVQALRGEPVTLYGDGSQTRSFCYVDDLKEALLRLMRVDAVSGPLNLGNPSECTVLELALLVQKHLPSFGPVVYRPLPVDDPKRRKPDISKAQKELGWNPKVGLEQGLMETIRYFERVLSGCSERKKVCLM